ncbi:MAG: tetratricopeptide repeat-containing sensor histidine kinase [Cyclobacteriaceae bacterium]|jgi:signal transduction histidine kinase|nr:tetratricopeptide repeat-containing sensor histidine kinase [Cyclobacteriaceae bacterium]
MHRTILKYGITFCILLSCASLITAQDQSEIDHLLKIIETTQSDSVKIATLNTLSQQLYNVDLKQSLQFSREALMLSEQQPNNKGKLDAQNMLMRIHRRLGNFEIAIRYALDGAALATRLKDSLQLFESYSALGNIHSSILNYVEADQYLQKAYAVGVKSHKPGISATLNFIGRNFGKMGNYDSAELYILRAKKLEETNPQPGYTLSYIYNNLAEVYLGKGENKLALDYYKKSEALDKSQKSPFGITFTLNGLALVYKQMGEYKMAKEVIKKSLQISSKYFYRDKAKESYTILFEIYESQNDFQNALEAYKLANVYQDSIFSDEKFRTIENLKINYETDVMQRENELLRKDAQLKSSQLSKRNLLLIIGGGGGIFLILVIFLLYRNVRERNTRNRLLADYNSNLQHQVKKQTVDLQKANLELIKHNGQLEQFGYIASHNLRSPVARIMGLTSLIKMEQSLPKGAEDIINRLHESAHDLDEIISDLNTILEIRKGTELKLEIVDLNRKLEKAKAILSESIKKSHGTIETDFDAGKEVTGEKVYFESIIYNLLSNAIKYRSEERPLHISVRTKKSNGHFQIIFSDNGIGIDLDKFGGKLFSLYQRFHTHVEGKGLGLFLTKTQVESMGGTIEIKSEVNVGTTFIISFPI